MKVTMPMTASDADDLKNHRQVAYLLYDRRAVIGDPGSPSFTRPSGGIVEHHALVLSGRKSQRDAALLVTGGETSPSSASTGSGE